MAAEGAHAAAGSAKQFPERGKTARCSALLALTLALLTIAGCGPPGPQKRFAAASATIGGDVYVAGGISPRDLSDVMEKFDPINGTWTRQAPLPLPVANAAAAAHGGQFYLVGGRYYEQVHSQLLRYDPRSDSWTELAPMSEARWNLTAVVLDGGIFAIGGITGVGNGRQVSGTVERYDIQADRWETLPSLPTPRSNSSSVALHGKIYVISGRTGTGTGPFTTTGVEVWDAEAKSWSEAPPIQFARTQAAACVAGGMIHVVGGAANLQLIATAEAYNPATGRWVLGSDLSVPRMQPLCAEVDERIFVFGGATDTSVNAISTVVEELTTETLLPQIDDEGFTLNNFCFDANDQSVPVRFVYSESGEWAQPSDSDPGFRGARCQGLFEGVRLEVEFHQDGAFAWTLDYGKEYYRGLVLEDILGNLGTFSFADHEFPDGYYFAIGWPSMGRRGFVGFARDSLALKRRYQ